MDRSRLAVIREREGSARVKGIPPIRGFANGRECTFMHCLELVLEAIGRPVGYDDLMGISGMAFRLQFRATGWDVGNPDPLVGERCLDHLFAALGLEHEVRIVQQYEFGPNHALREAVKRSIDAGIPVLAANIMPPDDWGIITGYRPDRTWLCRAYNGNAQVIDQVNKGWPTAVVLITERRARPLSKAVHRASLRRGVAMWEQQRSGDFAMGHRAYEVWIDALGSVRSQRYVHANFWTYVSLIDARGAAVRYLRSIAGKFGAEGGVLLEAAVRYDRVVRLLLDGIENVPSEHMYRSTMPPWQLRENQIKTLRKVVELEAEAIELIRQAV